MKKKEAELLLKTALESEKEERQRIAKDLHDSVSSDLSAIRNYLVLIKKTETDEQKISLFSDLQDGVETAIENTRLVSYKLMPPLLDQYGFLVALDDYINRLNKKSGVRFELSTKDDSFKLDTLVGYELYRVVQEFTTNMMKYGGVTQCSFFVYVTQDIGCIELVDDGATFDFYNELSTSQGLGLKNISSRLKVIGANLLQREVVEGNHFLISLPVLEEKK
ncbi:MAG: hypothetical protein J0L86_05580 [Flavobacteriales bacterium]|nr:hypothetical protein [Flavobacteriales bacterium]